MTTFFFFLKKVLGFSCLIKPPNPVFSEEMGKDWDSVRPQHPLPFRDLYRLGVWGAWEGSGSHQPETQDSPPAPAGLTRRV